jgi:hypothetical protein
MLVLGIILGAFGAGFLCWLLFSLALYALPFFAGMTAGLAAYHSGAGVIGALFVGFAGGVVTLIAGQAAFAVVKSPVLRGAIALLFAAPAAIAGYHATLGLAHIGVPSASWCEVFAILGAILVGGTGTCASPSQYAQAQRGHSVEDIPSHPAPLDQRSEARSAVTQFPWPA